MDIEAISMEIVKIRSRLREIEAEREELADDDLRTKTDLHDEEIELKSRLAELQDMTTGGGSPAQLAGEKRGKSKPEDFLSRA